MGKFAITSNTIFLFWFIILILTRSMFFVGGDEKGNGDEVQERSKAEEIFRDAYTALTKSSLSSLDRIKALINELQTKYFPPNLDFRSRDIDPSDSKESATEKMITAAGRSFGASKEAVEEFAKTAATAVGDVVQKTKGKGTQSKPIHDNVKDEL
ncbi:hypothetical protein Leryth_026143 [Lithospermum erythrorhizon]|nr:hypothetical protein Leryth_026143 [Lithospermum erythrorhizon]